MLGQKKLIEEFLAAGRIAVVGVSRNPRDFTRMLWTAFRPMGAIPVHPDQKKIDGVRCYPDLRSIDPPPDAALILVGKEKRMVVLEECRSAGITLAWIYGVSGPQSLPGELLAWCNANGMRVVAGYCPFMFLPHATWFHRLHGAAARLIGRYPA